MQSFSKQISTTNYNIGGRTNGLDRFDTKS